MKAIQIHQTGAPGVLTYTDIEKPAAAAGQVLIKMVSISVNWADVMIRKGSYPMMPALPVVPGIDGAGVVEAVGEGVMRIKPGQMVQVLGEKCYAELMVADAASVSPIPEGVDPDEAAVLPVNYLTAYHMLHTQARVQPGQSVLVYAAAGGVGTAAIQLGKLAEITVIGLTSSEEKAQFTKDQGITHIINYKKEDVLQRIRDITAGKGVDLVLNSVAGDTFNRDFEALAPLGQIIWFGMAAGMPEQNLLEPLVEQFGKSIGIRAFVLFTIPAMDPGLMQQSMETLLAYLADRKINPHIHERIPLAEAARAHELLESGKVAGKIILKP